MPFFIFAARVFFVAFLRFGAALTRSWPIPQRSRNCLEMEQAVKSLEIEDDMGNILTVKSFCVLEPKERADRYRAAFPEESKNAEILALDTGDVEQVAAYADGKATLLQSECGITLCDLSPSQLVEYTYGDEKGPWLLSKCSLMALEAYRKMKFKQWEKAIKFPDCMASFRRLLKLGVVTTIFDHMAFPHPSEEEKKQWQVKNESGKIINIPRPVAGLRIWNKAKKAYESVQSHMEGAPEPKDAQKYWEGLLNELRETRGAKLIDDILAEDRI